MNKLDLISFFPPWAQDVAVSCEGLRIARTRYGRRFRRALTEAEDRLFWTADDLRDFQERRLQLLVGHCYHTVPFYRRVFDERGLKPPDIQTVSDLCRLPVINRSTVVANWSDFLSRTVPRRAWRHGRSGGTTGQPLHYIETAELQSTKWATWWRYRRHNGIDLGTWVGLWAQTPIVLPTQTEPPYWRVNHPGHEVRFSLSHMNRSTYRLYVDQIERRGITWLHGFPSLLSVLAGFMLDDGVSLPGIRWVTTGAENLLPNQADAIRAAFGVEPLQHYGNCECTGIFSQCPCSSLHVDEDFSIVEFLPPDIPGSNGQRTVVGTTLWNYAMPLLRYDMGDLVVPSGELCACGRAGRLIRSLDGRLDDLVVCADGTPTACFNEILKCTSGIEAAQIHQLRAGEMTVRIVKRPGFTVSSEAVLLERFRLRVGERQMKICFEYPDEIPRTAAGKHRMVVSTVNPASGIGV